MADENKERGEHAIQKIEDMYEYAYPALAQFPKSEKYAMAADIKRCMDALLERCIEAEKAYYKKTTLREMDCAVAKLKHYVKLAYRLRFLPEKKFHILNDYLDQIGRMTGAWIAANAQYEKERQKAKK